MIRHLCLATLCSITLAPMGFSEDTVLIVQSYHQGYTWSDQLDQGIHQALDATGAKLEFLYMDTKRKTTSAEKEAAGAAALARVASLKPKVVINADDNAQTFFATKLKDRADVQMIFCGVNAEAETYGYPTANTTGILERPRTQQSFTLLKRLAPGVKTVGFLADDTETAHLTYAQLKASMPADVTVVSWLHARTFADWQAGLTAIQAQADAVAIYTYQSIEGADGKVMEPKAVAAWTEANLTKPSVAFLDWPVREGLLCGIAESPTEHGYLAGKMAAAVLSGKTAKDLPMTQGQKGTLLLNLKTAGKLGLEVPYDLIEAADVVVK
jgi:ABC-type uncharacterized transport system substrate-binding protein